MKTVKLIAGFLPGIILGTIVLLGCKQPYDPPPITTDYNVLVVDGFLNNSADPTIITLSRTKKIQDGVDHTGEVNAQLSIEDASGTTVAGFQELGNGQYSVPGLLLNENNKYRLRINTSNGKQYLSDEIDVKNTPAIDSVSWNRTDKGIMIYANTHDPQNNTWYYRWDYTETWDYYANYYSGLKYENGLLIPRQLNESLFECWSSQNSTGLILGTSAKLSEDRISLKPIRFIPQDVVELSVKYSLLLRQYALTKKEFNYFQNLQKISEQMGSIFDAQPSQLAGNIHCLNNPGEDIIGFMTAATPSSKRIFISHSDVLPWNFNFYCDDQKIVPRDSFDFYFGVSGYTPTVLVIGPPGGPAYGAHTECVDCRSRGGTNIKPDFWQ